MEWAKLYHGFLATPLLWDEPLNGLKQLKLSATQNQALNTIQDSPKRLGALAEHFTFEFWDNIPGLDILVKNIQIQGSNETLGELDAIIRLNEQIYHVEIAYKVYLYDPEHGNTALEHWIGPNRKDTLQDKLKKLRDHQLPLIHLPETQAILKNIVPPETTIASRTWVKGQLFVPLHFTENPIPLNSACVAGVYVNLQQLKSFDFAKFYLPRKLDWMMEPHTSVDWKNYTDILQEIAELHEKNYSPMLWMKEPKGKISKLFVIWW